ncbi:Os10g0350650 [Oryza sativa Japonica Group]|uniref:Os10g0350650 protein n=1 Tax=Oryza sativa subsp. japonica TaxID=39947 RepID=A0A0P0XTP8_ORYSJ|nr:Os10g0350650 [Oryza sativa Japonica Group]
MHGGYALPRPRLIHRRNSDTLSGSCLTGTLSGSGLDPSSWRNQTGMRQRVGASLEREVMRWRWRWLRGSGDAEIVTERRGRMRAPRGSGLRRHAEKEKLDLNRWISQSYG